jgi:hypothetical protein
MSENDRTRHSIEAKVSSGLKRGRAIRAVFDLALLSAGVLLFAFLDTPMRPYLIATAVVMGGIIICWRLLNR